MTAEVIHAWDWDTPERQLFVSVGLGRDQIRLHESVNSGVGTGEVQSDISKIDALDITDVVECFDYAPSRTGIVGYGGLNGTVYLVDMLNLSTTAQQPLIPRVQRVCNDISFNSSGLIATGLDRSKNDDSVQIWDITVQGRVKEPLMSTFGNETISCVQFLPSRPTSLLCGGHKLLREVDTRTAKPVSQVVTKYAIDIGINPLDDSNFYSYSDSGALALWDRRMLAGSLNVSQEPLLLIPRVFNDQPSSGSGAKPRRVVKFSTRNMDELAVLHDGGLIRRWIVSTTPGPQHTTSHLSSGLNESGHDNSTSLFVSRVVDLKTDYDKVVGFDYAMRKDQKRLDFICVRQSGQLFRMQGREAPTSLHFDPFNNFSMAAPYHVECLPCQETSGGGDTINDEDENPTANTNTAAADVSGHYSQRDSSMDQALSDSDSNHSAETLESDEDDDIDHGSSVIPYQKVLMHDIEKLMQQRAFLGYSLNAEKNVEALRDSGKHVTGYGPTALAAAWSWIRQQKDMSLTCDKIDLSYCGVASVWGEMAESALKARTKENSGPINVEEAVKLIVSRFPGEVFISPKFASEPETWAYRQLCLRLAGWNFGLPELESRLEILEARGEHEKAAGWAAFHGNVERAVESLARSRKKNLRLMSTAVAGYLVYKDVPTNNIWREQCRRLASEMSMPYLRAIFAYIADGSWLDVLDDGSLPLTERLGIALRFLSRQDLTRYLLRLMTKAINSGDLEGLVLTGFTPGAVDLLQTYLDRTADIQTVSLLGSYGWPRFLDDDRIPGWIAEYRKIINSWRYFAQRARFDVGRNHLAESAPMARPTESPVPRQIYLRCAYCKAPIGGPTTDSQTISASGGKRKQRLATHSRCPNCNHPLPKCSVCLLPLGPSLEDESPSDQWPTFCLSCNHAYHSCHARQWFSRYDICPVPTCRCLCGRQ